MFVRIVIIALLLSSCNVGEKNPYADQNLTYSKDIAPIIHQNCTPCHRPGEAGPFKLISHHDVSKRAKMVAQVVEDRYMPPWPANREYSTFLNEWDLEDDEINMILAWVDQGAPIGNKDSVPSAPEYPNASQLGEPDMTIKMTEPYHIIGNNTDRHTIISVQQLGL